jgi:hypothetical protein
MTGVPTDNLPLPEELTRGEGLSLAAAAALLPASPRGRPPTAGTLARWAADGVLRKGGGRVRLEALRVGGRLYTSRPALVRFLAALNEGAR